MLSKSKIIYEVITVGATIANSGSMGR